MLVGIYEIEVQGKVVLLPNINRAWIQSSPNVKFCNFYNSKTKEMWKEEWYLTKIEDTEKILKKIGL